MNPKRKAAAIVYNDTCAHPQEILEKQLVSRIHDIPQRSIERRNNIYIAGKDDRTGVHILTANSSVKTLLT